MKEIEKKAEEYAVKEWPRNPPECYQTTFSVERRASAHDFEAGFRAALAEALPLIRTFLSIAEDIDARAEEKACRAFLEKYEGEK